MLALPKLQRPLMPLLICSAIVACAHKGKPRQDAVPQAAATVGEPNNPSAAAVDEAYYIFIVPGFGYDFGEKLKKINPNIENSPLFQAFNSMASPIFQNILPQEGSLLEWQQKMESYAKLFGLPDGRVRILNYSYFSNTEKIKQEITDQITAAMATAPANARFDIIGHSEGGFAGFYGVMDGPFAGRLRKFVSLAGVPLGWSPIGILGVGCRTGACGLTHLKIIPRRSGFIESFLSRDAAAIRQVDTCSLYASDDGFVNPPDAGAFETGLAKSSINQEVPGMTHLRVFDSTFFTSMQTICYPEGFHVAP